MKIKICTPIIGKTLSEFLKNLTQVQAISEMVELRIDGLNLTEKDLILIRKKTVKVAILTSKRKDLILKALDLKFNFIDINLSLMKTIELSKPEKDRIILSFHDFKKTPNIGELREMVNKMKKFKTGVIKIATMVENDQDVKNLFQILLRKNENEKMIVVGMGEKGKLTRFLGPILGSFLTFASTKFGNTAPGQIDIKKIKNIYKLLT